MSFAAKIKDHLARNWAIYLVGGFFLGACLLASGCVHAPSLPPAMGEALRKLPHAASPATCSMDVAYLHWLGLVCFALSVASVIARVWLPILPVRLTVGLLAGGFGAYIVAWIVAKLIWLLAVAALIAGAEFGWRWWKARQKASNP